VKGKYCRNFAASKKNKKHETSQLKRNHRHTNMHAQADPFFPERHLPLYGKKTMRQGERPTKERDLIKAGY